MHHPLDRAVASDLSYQCLQLRRLRAEQGLEPLDSTLARLKPIPGAYEEYFPTFGDGDRACANPPSVAVGERE